MNNLHAIMQIINLIVCTVSGIAILGSIFDENIEKKVLSICLLVFIYSLFNTIVFFNS